MFILESLNTNSYYKENTCRREVHTFETKKFENSESQSSRKSSSRNLTSYIIRPNITVS